MTVADIALVATFSTIKACEGVTDLSSYEVGYKLLFDYTILSYKVVSFILSVTKDLANC